MPKPLKNIALLLFVAAYFLAASGLALEGLVQCYSTGDESAITFHTGEARDLPVPSLTHRTYTPLTQPVVVIPAGFAVSTIVYPTVRPAAYIRFEEALPSYTAEVFSALADRAPPSA